MDLSGKTALVTGAGRRIGRALALSLAEAGARVAVHHNTSAGDAAETVETIHSIGREAEAFQADLADPDQVEGLEAAVRERFGPVQVLVNNAALFGRTPIEEATLEQWERYMAVNFRAPFLLSRAMWLALPEGAPGKIINLNDWQTARSKRFVYGASKGALSALTRSLAVAMAPRVQVNEVALGVVLPPADDSEVVLGHAGRPGTLNEVAQAVLSLIGNDFITGETLHVDGGRHVR